MGKTYNVAELGGDGTGPEVVREAKKVLAGSRRIVSDLSSTGRATTGVATVTFVRARCFRRMQPKRCASTTRFCLARSVIPMSSPAFSRRAFCSSCASSCSSTSICGPVKIVSRRLDALKDKGPEHIDFVVVRENNEGIYTGAGGFLKYGTPEEVATQVAHSIPRGL